ncbi:MAG: hypothetical protein CL902_01010 [Dehalococcoidia bacterium]|nr:hypothetical protein [Dehalococcoidia bacterium]
MHEIMMTAFHDELEKIAVSANFIQSMVGSTVPRHALQSGMRGTGGLGRRQAVIEELSGFGPAGKDLAAQANTRTNAQMANIARLVRRKQDLMKTRPPIVSGNPKSRTKAIQYAKDLNTLDDIRSNVLSPFARRNAFPIPK